MSTPIPRQRFARFSVCGMLWVLVAWTGCIGGQTGGEIRDTEPRESTGNDAGHCVDVDTLPLEESEATLGFSAAALLDTVDGEHTADLSWAEAGLPEGFTIAPEPGAGTITVTLTPLEETAQVVRRGPPERSCESEDCPLMSDIAAPCRDQLRFDAEVHVTTDNGALDETWRATFSAESPHLASAQIELRLGELGGSFDLTTSLADTAIEQLYLELVVAGGSLSGSLRGLATTSLGEAVRGTPLDIARFPVEGCDSGHPIAEDDPLAVDAEAALALASEFDLSWSGGDQTILTLSHEVRRACLRVEPYQALASVVLQLDTRALTEDSGIDGQWQLEAHIGMDANSQASTVDLLRQAYLASGVSGASFASETGIAAISVSADRQATFAFSVHHDLSGNGAATGELTVLELSPPPPCNTENTEHPDGSSGAGGCEGSSFQEVGGASLVAR